MVGTPKEGNAMKDKDTATISPRDFLIHGGSALALLAMMDSPVFAQAWGADARET